MCWRGRPALQIHWAIYRMRFCMDLRWQPYFRLCVHCLSTQQLHMEFAMEESAVSVVITYLIACGSILAMLSILLRQHIEQQKRLKEMTEELQRISENMA